MSDRSFNRRTADVADFFAAVPDALLIVDHTGLILDANPQSELMFGFGAGELVGRAVDSLVPERFRVQHGRHRADYVGAPRVRPMGTGPLLFACRKDGTEFPVDIRLGPLAHGGERLTLCIARDVTDRVAAERALRESEEQHRLVVDHIGEVLFRVDCSDGDVAAGRLRFVSGPTQDMMGRFPNELLADAGLWTRLIHPEDLAHVVTATNQLAESGATVGTREYRVRHADGRYRWIEDRIRFSRDARSVVVGMFGVARDVTARRAAETEIRTRAAQQAAVVELGREALAGGPLPALMQLAAELLAGTLGVECVEALELTPDRRDFWLVAGVGWRAGLVGRENAANDPGAYPGYVLIANGVVVLDEVAAETRFRVPGRLTEHGVVSGVSTVIGSVERPYGVLGAWTTRRRVFTRNDLHFVQAIAHLLGEAVERWLADDEVRRINAALETRVRERTAELESANRELEAFCRSVSHDLRAPLRGIDGFSLAVIEEYGERLDATGREYLQRVRAGIQRMGQIIDDLLALSRVLRVEMDRGPVDLSALATQALNELRGTDPTRRVDVVITPGIVTTGDARLLRLAIENLLGNAWKFTARRSDACIEFGVNEGDDTPIYFVRDNGAGFDMAYADQLFGVFQRLHRQSEFPGNGVGLATVRRIIERHGGRAWAEGAVEQGATFFFTL